MIELREMRWWSRIRERVQRSKKIFACGASLALCPPVNQFWIRHWTRRSLLLSPVRVLRVEGGLNFDDHWASKSHHQSNCRKMSFIAMAASNKTLTAESTLPGEWTVVLSRRGRQRRNPPLPKTLVQKQQQQQQQLPWAPTDFEINFVRESKLMQKIQITLKKLEISQFFLTLLDQIETPEMMSCFHRVLSSEVKMKMVIYGIGSIESYESPRLQLSLAILLKRRVSWIGDIEVFDPILSATESRVLEALGCSVLSINEQGRRQAQKPTMFFMPHCEAELYDNLLQANWGVQELNCLVLFGNSFETYEQHLSEFKNSSIIDSTRNILAVRRFTDEFRIKTVSDYYFGAFHDSSWHFFSPVLDTELQLSNC